MSTTRRAAPPAATDAPMSKRETLEALSGLLLALFVGLLSSTIVSNALPTITSKLEGTQSQYTWVVTAALLAATAATPIWGKLADLFSKKILVQSALVIFSIGSLIAGFAPSMEVLIGARAIQGLGVGGLTALVQVVIATMVSPRERGRYSGYIGAVFALATVSGPLVGGVLVDTVGWRWCFFAGLPVAALAFVVLQKTLRLPVVKRDEDLATGIDEVRLRIGQLPFLARFHQMVALEPLAIELAESPGMFPAKDVDLDIHPRLHDGGRRAGRRRGQLASPIGWRRTCR